MAPSTSSERPLAAGAASRNGRAQPDRSAGPRLVMLTDPRSAPAEAYRSLSTNLRFSSLDQGLHSLAVTSAGADEAKTTTVANLAVAMAEGGRQVIAVDADLRRPSLHTLFGLSNREGLTTALLAEAGQLPLQDTPVAGVRLLASGPLPANPAEVLASRRLDRVLALLRERADVVLFDTAPAAVLADAAVLAPRLDGVLLVVSVGRTKRDLARQAKEHLERVNARLVGVVLTGARANAKLYAY